MAVVSKEVDGIGLLLNQLMGSVGKPGRVFKKLADPTVWGTLGSNTDWIQRLKLELNGVSNVNFRVKKVEAKVRGLEIEIGGRRDGGKGFRQAKSGWSSDGQNIKNL